MAILKIKWNFERSLKASKDNLQKLGAIACQIIFKMMHSLIS
jgi:hypothetical protein